MKKTIINFTLVIVLLVLANSSIAQENKLNSNYIGLNPSALVEPYDTIDAVEVNIFPLLYEFRTGEKTIQVFKFGRSLTTDFSSLNPDSAI